MKSPNIERALVSVSDKLGLIEVALGLVEAGIEIFASGGSRRLLEQAGIPVREVAAYTAVTGLILNLDEAITRE